ncbi:MAG TPA: NAD-dependent epimerase/dehydratase family protein [Nitrosopumilaceae archaeon]|nr:NAD-dependent epimerase/dehydratase family protein [Nitrosopumilaceae archaeon]
MNFIVTGGAGFIGSHIVEHLVEQNHSVTVIDNFHTGKLENLARFRNKIEILDIDILDYEKLRNAVKNTDGVFHEAALTLVQESFTKQKEYHDVNVTGTENIFKLAKEFGFKVVYASSSSVYGDTKKIPIKEDVERKPLNPYGNTKLEDEYLAEKYSKLGVFIIGLRYFNVYGPRQNIAYAGVITKFLENIANGKAPIINGDGLQVRDFVHVGDVAKANLMAMESKVNFAFANIGTGTVLSINDLADIIIKASGLAIKPVHNPPLEGDVKDSQADVSLTKKLLGWKAEIKLKDWLNETVQKIMKN